VFRQASHRRAHTILSAFDASLLAQHGCYFGGGTRIVLELEEFRISEDLDFLCSQREGFAELRRVAKTAGYDRLFTGPTRDQLAFPREIRTDQYGIRFPVECDGYLIKVELIHEGRIDLDPGTRPAWSPMDCISLPDCFAEKLLANADRWRDRQVLSRDAIDLAALRYSFGPIPGASWDKAVAAYKESVRTDLRKALDLLAKDAEYRQRCFEALSVSRSEEILAGVSGASYDGACRRRSRTSPCVSLTADGLIGSLWLATPPQFHPSRGPIPRTDA
jgi:hypothetical protein